MSDDEDFMVGDDEDYDLVSLFEVFHVICVGNNLIACVFYPKVFVTKQNL